MARTVLVVADDPLVLEVTADMLKDLGCEVVTAASGMDAIERLSVNTKIEIWLPTSTCPAWTATSLSRGRPSSGPDCK